MTPGPHERLIRRYLNAMDARPVGHSAPQPEGAPDPEPPAAPPATGPAPGPATTDRIPPWWAPKPPLSAEPPGEQHEEVAKEGAPACSHPEPHPVRARPTGELVAYWCSDCETQLEVPDGYTDDEDQGDETADGRVPALLRRHWTLRGSGKTYRRPSYRKPRPAPRQSLIDWWQGLDRRTCWFLYNGTAITAGFALGVPQWFTAETAYLAATSDSWTDPGAFAGYVITLGVWMWDYRTRGWIPPFALPARIPLASLLVGVPLYGTDVIPA
ncbi:hypothetical protein [Streptomyces sp. NRRL B-1347]|uniref:hypothetical protein n=1 Tax=Streptomyces sp. NRRL B-1347 TaxID=1476877 RepID=UPI0004C7233B|nr:hypothetical protein [Streptomyces sp. NRRL B-1347]